MILPPISQLNDSLLTAATSSPNTQDKAIIDLLFEESTCLHNLLTSLCKAKPFLSYEDLINRAQDSLEASLERLLQQPEVVGATSSSSSSTATKNADGTLWKALPTVLHLNRIDLIDIVNAHPRIGAPLGSLSLMSQIEQQQGKGGGGDTTIPQSSVTATAAATLEPGLAETLVLLKSLNEVYERKFGFKFVIFVNGRSRAVIAQVLQDRLSAYTSARGVEVADKESQEHHHRAAVAELRSGLGDMILIARDRLKKLQQKAAASL